MTGATRRRAVRRLSLGLAFASVIIALAACFPLEPAPSPSPTRSGAASPAAVAPLAPLVVPAVLNYCPLVDAVHYSGYPLPIDEVYICRADGTHDTDGTTSYGPWESAWRVDHPEGLLLAYRRPDAMKSRTVCSSHPRADPLIVWVHRNGVTTAYYAPVDGCGAPSSAAAAAYAHAQRTLLVEVDRGAPDPSKTGAVPRPSSTPSTPSTKDSSG
ncbi:hypothetical protein ACFPJ4_06765 [Lysinimonas soli]|uniref:DUF3558 domain-containing protein n=1 Tax=Lysinimonas soli TaxID=1074233 RepID=A0ABW0NPU7_9MICO